MFADLVAAAARALAWAVGAAAAAGGWLHIDVDATITIDHSNQNTTATWKKNYGHHPLPVFLDRPDIADSEALARLLRVRKARSNTATGHITVLGWALHAHVEGSASDIARRSADALWRNLIDNRHGTAVRQPA